MKKLLLTLSLLGINTYTMAAQVYCTGVVDSIQVNNNGTINLGLTTSFDGTTVPVASSIQALSVAQYSFENNALVRIHGFSDSNDSRCRDNNESIEFRSIRLL